MGIQGIQSSSVQPISSLRHVSQQTAEAAPAEQRSAPAYDRYEPETEPERQSAGLYQIVHGEDGSPELRFDSPSGSSAPAAPDQSKAVRTTTNTDQVDQEIRALREKQTQLKRQMEGTADPVQRQALEKQLSQVEQELQQKDNDTYRRQHAVIF